MAGRDVRKSSLPTISVRSAQRAPTTFLSLIQRDKGQRVWAGIFGEGADQAIVGRLLQNVGSPAGHAGDGEGGREEIDGDAHGIQHNRRIEIDVSVEAASR